jgi:oxygen-independent coproporphyrinogen-3 oxidase
LYFHIPFCNTICYYCACNKIITKDHGRSAKYLKYLARELALQSSYLEGGDQEVAQLHWGGGTPTFLSHDEMRQLMAATRAALHLIDGGEYSIEVDPRKVDQATVALLGELGFNRMSVGVQDFDPSVQQAVNRLQSEEETRAVIDAARASGFKSVSVDLIYGLPKQTSPASTARSSGSSPPARIASRSTTTPTCRACSSRSAASSKRTCRSPTRAADPRSGHPQDDRSRLRLSSAWTTSPSPTTNSPSPSARGACTATSRAIRRIRTATCWPSASRRSARSGRPTARTSRRSTSTTTCSTTAPCRSIRGIELNADDLLRRSIIQSLMCHFELSIESIEIAHLIDFRKYFATELDDLRRWSMPAWSASTIAGSPFCHAGRMLVRASRWSSTATCAPTGSAPATRR